MNVNFGYVLDNGRKMVCRNGADFLIDDQCTRPITMDEKWFLLGLYFQEHGDIPQDFLEDEQGNPLDLG
jgi:hypothetical protein